MPCAVVRVMPRSVNVDRVIAVGDGRDATGREHAAYLLQDRRSARGMRWRGRRIYEVSEMRDAAGNLAAGASVFVAGPGVVAAANTHVPGIEAANLIRHKNRICPTGSPEDACRDRRRQNIAVMVDQVRRVIGFSARLAATKVWPQHRRVRDNFFVVRIGLRPAWRSQRNQDNGCNDRLHISSAWLHYYQTGLVCVQLQPESMFTKGNADETCCPGGN